MTDNPFSSPSLSAEQAPKEQGSESVGRPLGVSILAVLLLIGGVLLIGAQLLMLANLSAMGDALSTIGISPILLIIGVIFLAVVTIASGIGMWIGAKWGWWLGAFYYMYSVFRNVSALVTIVSIADQFEASERGLEHYVVKHGVRIVIQLLLFLYFFKGNVLAYFGLQNLNKAMAAGIIVGVCIAITAVLSGLAMVLN